MSSERNNTPTTNLRTQTWARPDEAHQDHPRDLSWSGAGIDLQNYLRILFKYRYLIFLFSVLGIVSAILYSVLATPMYTAEFSLRIGMYNPVLPSAEGERQFLRQSAEQDYLNTQIEMLTSLTLADRVLSDEELGPELVQRLQSHPGFISRLQTQFKELVGAETESDGQGDQAYMHELSMLKSYLRLVHVTPVRKTSLVRVSAITSDPKLSQKIANTHAKEFIEFVRSQRQQKTIESIAFLKTQAEDLAKKVSLTERNIAQYSEENSIIALNEKENITVQKMSELNQLLTAAIAKRIKSQANVVAAKEGNTVVGDTSDHPGLVQVVNQLDQAEAEYAMLSEKFMPTYPRMLQLHNKILTLKSQIKGEQNRSFHSLEAQYQSDLQSEEQLKKQLEIQKSKTFELSRSQVQYNIMKREFDSLRDLHQSVLRELKQAQLNSENISTNVSLVDQAPLPRIPSSPQRFFALLLGLFCGPFFGILAAFIAELMDNTLKTPDEAFRVLNLPTLGVVPSFEAEVMNKELLSFQKSTPEKTDAVHSDILSSDQALNASIVKSKAPEKGNLILLNLPKAIASESYRIIRTGILLSGAGSPPKVLLVTSAKQGEGKTTLSSNLAVSLAQFGKKTIAIDADLRRPSLSKYFGLNKNLPGLVDFLTGQAELGEIIHRTSVPNLLVIPSGPIPPNPAELLGSRNMEIMIQLLAEEWDHVLIDASPVLPVTDPSILSRFVDGVVMVVRANSTKRAPIRESCRRLQSVGAKVIGLVLNDVDVNSGDYYYYFRDTYSYYMTDEDQKKKRWKWGGSHSNHRAV
jgi:polysaccharide biosynthesis transport protein